MKNSRMLVWAALPVACVVASWFSSALSQQLQAPPARPGADSIDRAAVSHAESLSDAFRLASDAVLPTVVKIKSQVNPRRINSRGGAEENPFRGTPFEDFFDMDEFRGQFPQFSPRREGMGSGVIIKSDGLILTNNHVVKDADTVIVELADGREFTATDIRTDPKSDTAVLRINDAGTLPAARLGDSDEVRIGDWVLAIGHPFELEASVSAGIISAKGRSIGSLERASFLQTDAAINPGNSGGPLVNLQGEVVGINTAIASSSGGYQGIGFAIPINLTRWVVDQLVERGSVQRAWLGVGISQINQEMADSLGIDLRDGGVVVQQVGEGTPAEKAGIRPGDVITHFAGVPVRGPAELQREVERAPLGSKQDVQVVRRGKPTRLTVITEALPDDAEGPSEQEPSTGEGDVLSEDELGMQIGDLTDDLAQRAGLPLGAEGALVLRVLPGGIASESGLRRGMLITEVNSEIIRNADDFEKVIKDQDLDRGVTLTVRVPGVGARFILLKRR